MEGRSPLKVPCRLLGSCDDGSYELGGINRAGAAVPTFLRTPTMIQPHLDMKSFLQFPMETPPPPHSMSLFHNFNTAGLRCVEEERMQDALSPMHLDRSNICEDRGESGREREGEEKTGERHEGNAGKDEAESEMDPVQKAVINHTFGMPLIKTKRPVISCNVCQIRFNSESQAEAHYKGNRHARRVKGIETSKSRPQDGDKPPAVPPTTSPSPIGAPGTNPDSDPSKAVTPAAAAGPAEGNLRSSSGSEQVRPGQLVSGGPSASASISPSNPETEEDKAKKLLYCSLCKVAVNSLSQLEAHNKGTKHKTILEARSGLGPIKAYPRLGPKPSGEQGGGPVDPNTQERTFHCEICNVRVNSELQLKQVERSNDAASMKNSLLHVFNRLQIYSNICAPVYFQHISSRRHRDGMAGKPNPLLSRHKKHRGADLTSSLTFSKDLTKALGAGLLPNPLAVAAAMAAAASSNPLALRAAAPAPHPHHHLLQGPPLSHAILRPAPGPIRTTHGPILFSPY
ncbi:unnamed protein product, partial [Tetraodon nigroviridis]